MEAVREEMRGRNEKKGGFKSRSERNGKEGGLNQAEKEGKRR